MATELAATTVVMPIHAGTPNTWPSRTIPQTAARNGLIRMKTPKSRVATRRNTMRSVPWGATQDTTAAASRSYVYV